MLDNSDDEAKKELMAAQDYKVLQRVFERLDKKHDGKIDKDELHEYLVSVGYEPVKVNQYGVSEVEHMYCCLLICMQLLTKAKDMGG